MRADRSALSYEVDVPATTTGRDLSIMIERADIKGSSFAFSLEGPEDEAESWSIEPDGTLLRRVLRAKLWDVSPVSQGAYPKASVTGRAEPQPAGVPLETLRLRNDLLAMD